MTRPGVPTRYRMSEHGAPTRRGGLGLMVLKPNAGYELYKPTWEGKRTTIRIIKVKNPENPAEWDRFRFSEDPRDVGDWMRRYDAGVSLGVTNGCTFIVRDPRDDSMDMQLSPVNLLERTIGQAVRSGQCNSAWNPLIFGTTGKGAPLSKIRDLYLVQCVIIEHGNKPCIPIIGLGPQQRPTGMVLSDSAAGALLNACVEYAPGGEQFKGTGDYAKIYKHPDITDWLNGKFVTFYQSRTQQAQGAAAAPQSWAPGGASSNVAKTYDCVISDTYQWNGQIIGANLQPYEEDFMRKCKPWDDIVHIMPIKEQVELLAARFPPDAIIYALGDAYGEFIPEHIKQAAAAMYHAPVVPGWGGQQPAMQPGMAMPGTAPGGMAMPGMMPQAGTMPGMPGVAPARQQDLALPPGTVDGGVQHPTKGAAPTQPQAMAQPQAIAAPPAGMMAAPSAVSAVPMGMPGASMSMVAPVQPTAAPQATPQAAPVTQPPMGFAPPPGQPGAVPPGFAPAPTADPTAQASTMAALELARKNARLPG